MVIRNEKLIEQYNILHKSKDYGLSGKLLARHIQLCITELRPISILDYGCGQSHVESELDIEGIDFHRYDPAINDISVIPVRRVDFVINTDVLEHVPECDIFDLLSDIHRISDKVFFNISTRLAVEILPCGENAHCTVKTSEDWLDTIREVFPDAELVINREGDSCLILTWQTSLRPYLNMVDEFDSLMMENAELKRQNALLKSSRLYLIRASIKKLTGI